MPMTKQGPGGQYAMPTRPAPTLGANRTGGGYMPGSGQQQMMPGSTPQQHHGGGGNMQLDPARGTGLRQQIGLAPITRIPTRGTGTGSSGMMPGNGGMAPDRQSMQPGGMMQPGGQMPSFPGGQMQPNANFGGQMPNVGYGGGSPMQIDPSFAGQMPTGYPPGGGQMQPYGPGVESDPLMALFMSLLRRFGLG